MLKYYQKCETRNGNGIISVHTADCAGRIITGRIFCLHIGNFECGNADRNLCLCYENKKVYLAFNMNLLSIFIVCLMYFLTALWGIDSGMSLMGGVKFLPLLLWFLLIAGKKDRKERLIETLPVLGACMTLFSFVMMQFSIFEKSVSVAGRLAGFFQYPNTYALFMLICLVIAVDKLNWDKIDWLWCAYAGIAVFGIIMSGSRTVLLLMLVLGAWYCVKRKLPGKVLLMAAGGCAVLVVLLWITGVGKRC